MDRAINTPSAQQAVVGGIDNGLHLLFRNVAFHQFQDRASNP
jgi:hypothetical protein